MALRKRRLAILWLTETWSAAWFWLSRWTSCSMDSPCSTSRCSSQLRARCNTGLCRDKRWQNSATNELDTGRSDFAMSATTTTRWDGFFSAISCRRSTHKCRKIAILSGDGQPGGDALEVLDQPQPQHDGDGPELAQFQGAHRLVSGDEGAGAAPHQSVHPRARSVRARCRRRAAVRRKGRSARRGNSRL